MADAGLVARRTVDGEVIEWLAVPPRAAALGLEPHPEGGWYRRTWTAPDTLATANGVRPAATLIHFLLPPGESSAWHVVSSDELWLWHGPDPVSLQFGGSGDAPVASETVQLGLAGASDTPDAASQVLVPAGVWQRTLPSAGETLVSCLVSPGFSFEDWSLEPDAPADA